MSEPDPLANVDLDMVTAPRAPAGFADGVLARFATTEAAIAVEKQRRARRARWRIGGALTALAATIAVVLAWPHSRANGRIVADAPRRVTLGDIHVELGARSSIDWRRDGKLLSIEQHGTATWHVPAGEHLHVEVPGAAAVDATDATLNLEVQMNADTKTIGSAAAVISAVTVAVVAGKALLAGGGDTMTVETGKAAMVTPGQKPRGMLGPRNPTTAVVLVFPADEAWLDHGQLESIQRALTELQLPMGSTIGAVMYSDRADVALQPKSLYEVRGDELGALERYKGKHATALVDGITAGIEMTRNSNSVRRVVIVLGDGRDAEPALRAQTALKTVLGEAMIDRVEVRAIVTPPAGPETPELFDLVKMPHGHGTTDLTRQIVEAVNVTDSTIAVTLVFPDTQRWVVQRDHRFAVEALLEENLGSGVTFAAVSYGAPNATTFPVRTRLDVLHADGDVIDAVQVAVERFAGSVAAKRLVVVLDDGHTPDDERAKKHVADTLVAAQIAHVEVKAILVRDEVSNRPSVFATASLPAKDATNGSLVYWLRDAVGLPPRDARAVMLVYAGRDEWISNDLLDHIGAGISNMYLPQGSQLAAIEYSTGATIRIPWESAESFQRAQLGSEPDYRGHVGSDLVQGVMMGLAELAKQPPTDRHLILVGDDADTNNDAARVMLQQLAAEAKRLGVRIHVVNVHGHDSPTASVAAILDPGPTLAGGSGAGQAEEVEAIITSIGAAN